MNNGLFYLDYLQKKIYLKITNAIEPSILLDKQLKTLYEL